MTTATPDLRSWFRLVAPQVQPTLFGDCPRKGGQRAGELEAGDLPQLAGNDRRLTPKAHEEQE